MIAFWGATAGLVLAARLLTRELLGQLTPAERCLVAGDGEGVEAVAQKIAAGRLNASVVATVQLDVGISPFVTVDREEVLEGCS